MTEAETEYLQNCISYVTKSMIASLLLTLIDYIWPYDRKIKCDILADQYTYNWSCDREDDWGQYDRQTIFKADCSEISYQTTSECVTHQSDTLYIDGSQYDCWTNQICSIQPIFYNIFLGEWPWNICLIPAMIFFIIALITFVEILIFLINLYRKCCHDFWNVISMAVYQRITLNANISTELFMNGYFREIQMESNLEGIIVPLDIIKLCIRFYTISTHTFNQYTLSIQNPMHDPIENAIKKDIFIKYSIQKAKQKRYEYGVGFLFILSLYIAIFIREQLYFIYEYHIELRIMHIQIILLLVAIYLFFSFLYQYRRSMHRYYCMTPWSKALHFDPVTEWVKYIEYCVDYGGKYNIYHMKEPIIYIRNVDNICKFEQLAVVGYGVFMKYDLLQLEFRDMYRPYSINIPDDSYEDIVCKMKQIIQRMNSTRSWERTVTFR